MARTTPVFSYSLHLGEKKGPIRTTRDKQRALNTFRQHAKNPNAREPIVMRVHMKTKGFTWQSSDPVKVSSFFNTFIPAVEDSLYDNEY